MAKAEIKPIKSLLADMKAAKKQQSDIEKEIKRIGTAIIDMCPKKKGDIVMVNAGWTHLKKQMSITRIAFGPVNNEYVFDGKVLRADGSVGLNSAKAVLGAK